MRPFALLQQCRNTKCGGLPGRDWHGCLLQEKQVVPAGHGAQGAGQLCAPARGKGARARRTTPTAAANMVDGLVLCIPISLGRYLLPMRLPTAAVGPSPTARDP